MKEGVSNIWLIGIIILFISIFASYIAVTINYTASFKIKNEALSIIEKHKGMTQNSGSSGTSIVTGDSITTNVGAMQTINLYLLGKAYTAIGECPREGSNVWYGVKTLTKEKDASSYEEAKSGTKYYYCFSRYSNKKITGYPSVYYKVRFFYRLDFPAVSEFLSIKVDGLTDEIYAPQDEGLYTTNNNIYDYK